MPARAAATASPHVSTAAASAAAAVVGTGGGGGVLAEAAHPFSHPRNGARRRQSPLTLEATSERTRTANEMERADEHVVTAAVSLPMQQ